MEQPAIIKFAFIRKVKGKGYCVFSHHRDKGDKGGKRRNFGCYKSRAEAKKRLGQLYFFKGRGALDAFIEVADDLDSRGMLHLADAVMDCLHLAIAASFGELENQDNLASVKLGKVAVLIEKKGEPDIAEKIDAILPDVLDLESASFPCVNCPDDEVSAVSQRCSSRRSMPADRLYRLAVKLRKMYSEGLVDEKSFEYRKFREFRYMLKTGFLLPPPDGGDIPKDADNWWDHFEKEGGR